MKIDDPVAVGLSLGGTGHAVGTGTAFRYGPVAGAMGGLAIGVTGVLYVFVSPIVANLILSKKEAGQKVFKIRKTHSIGVQKVDIMRFIVGILIHFLLKLSFCPASFSNRML